jgi:chromosome partitioning protein
MPGPIIITIANHKGGVGKSTIATHLAWYLTERDYKTILVDLDAQTNSTSTFVDKQDLPLQGGSDYLFNDSQPMPALVAAEGYPLLSIIPSTAACRDIDRQPSMGAYYTFPERIRSLNADFIVLDTPPADGNRIWGAIAAASLVVTPFQPEEYSVSGLKSLSVEIDGIRRRLNQKLGDPLAVCNMYVKRSNLHDEFVEGVEKSNVHLLKPYLSRLLVVAETSSMQTPVWRLKNRAGAEEQWLSIMKQIHDRAMETRS